MPRRFFILFALLSLCLLVPGTVRAASLFLSPSSGSHAVDSDFSVAIRVNTSGVAINASQASTSFSKDTLEIKSISKSGIFNLWVTEPTYSNSAGTITFSGGVPNPGYTGTAGTIATVTFHAKAAGTATVTINSGSVLANDGKGTNVLTSRGSATYTITAAPAPPPEKNLPGAPTITSLTHPDQNAWTTNANPAFSWSRQDGVTGFSYSFDNQATATPDATSDSILTQQGYSNTGDGNWYFHVRAQNSDGWGAAGHYRVRIDTTPPSPFVIELLDGASTRKRSPRLSFAATDATSGIHHYSLSLNGETAVNIDADKTQPYTLSDLPAGEYNVMVTAYDFAGNHTASTASFAIIEATAPTSTEEPAPPTGVLKILDTVTKKINSILPKPLQQLTTNLGQTIQNIQQSNTVSNVIDNIIQPTVTATAIVTATGVVATSSALELTNIFYLFFRFGYFWLVPISLGKKRKPWGVVFDSTTGKPIKRAIVRIFSKEFNKLRESQITDADGRFGFLIGAGEYYVTVTIAGFVFPSHFLRTAAISQYEHIYRGEPLIFHEQQKQALSINIPVDPELKEVSPRRLAWLKILNVIGYVLEKLNLPLLIGGTILSWLSLIIQPITTNYIILGVYIVLLAFKLILRRRLERSSGLIKDADTGAPIDLAIVRIYDMKTGYIIGTKITNSFGQFNALVLPGQYYLVVIKPEYETFQSEAIEVTRRHGLIHLSVDLHKKKDAANVAAGGIIHLKPMLPSLPAPAPLKPENQTENEPTADNQMPSVNLQKKRRKNKPPLDPIN